jgi:hypothetical protein
MAADIELVMQATGNLDEKVNQVLATLKEAGQRAKTPGKELEGGLRGAIDRARDLGREMNKFIAAGAVGYRLWSAGARVWSAAHTAAAERVTKANTEAYQAARKLYDTQVQARSEGWERMNTVQQLRMAGVDNDDQIERIRASLATHEGPHGERIRNQLFPQIAQQLGQQRLSGEETGQALERAVAALNKFGHVSGFGDAYGALAGNRELGGRGDLDQMALALALRQARLSEDERSTLTQGLSSGTIAVGAGGELSGGPQIQALLDAVNALGGLSLRRDFEGWRPRADQISHIGGVVTAARQGEASAFALPGGLTGPSPVAPTAPAAVKDSEVSPEILDYLKAAGEALVPLIGHFASTAVALGAFAVSTRMAAAAAARMALHAGAGGVSAAVAGATGAGTGAAGTAAIGWGGRILAGIQTLAARAPALGAGAASGLAALTAPGLLEHGTIFSSWAPQERAGPNGRADPAQGAGPQPPPMNEADREHLRLLGQIAENTARSTPQPILEAQ